MAKLSGIELKRARLVPSSAFASPDEVLGSPELSRAQKIAILRRWEFDSRPTTPAAVIRQDGPILDQVRRALRDLGAGPADCGARERDAPLNTSTCLGTLLARVARVELRRSSGGFEPLAVRSRRVLLARVLVATSALGGSSGRVSRRAVVERLRRALAHQDRWQRFCPDVTRGRLARSSTAGVRAASDAGHSRRGCTAACWRPSLGRTCRRAEFAGATGEGAQDAGLRCADRITRISAASCANDAAHRQRPSGEPDSALGRFQVS